MGRFAVNLRKRDVYYVSVKQDFEELKTEYPFAMLTIPPTVEPSLASITVIAVNNVIIDAVCGRPEDFIGEYSKKLRIEIPEDYKTVGCRVFGCGWFDESKFKNKDIHLYHRGNKLIENAHGYEMCVGTPESFPMMKNVILEAVRTADNIMVAYERVQRGETDKVILNAYSHGDAGREEYRRDKKRYKSR